MHTRFARCLCRVVVTLGVAWPALLPAQTPRVVFGGVELAIAAGSGRGGEYTDRKQMSSRLGIALALRAHPALDVTLGADWETLFLPGDRVDVCVIGTDGECVPWFPEFRGWSVTGGVRWRPDPRLAIGARVGGGRYRIAENHFSSGQPRGATGTLVFREEIAVRVAPALWLFAVGSHQRFADVAGESIGGRQLGLGVRLQ
ncbi:MAG TPA: hypothetical protein VEA99_08910 [Gemmatimonadaceae bacterium]|nr:hypothetical protein [Gemmatimonadaceae bacterium]